MTDPRELQERVDRFQPFPQAVQKQVNPVKHQETALPRAAQPTRHQLNFPARPGTALPVTTPAEATERRRAEPEVVQKLQARHRYCRRDGAHIRKASCIPLPYHLAF